MVTETIRPILTNPIYAGVLLNHKTETIDFLTGAQAAKAQGRLVCSSPGGVPDCGPGPV